jgi:hypothetical protein
MVLLVTVASATACPGAATYTYPQLVSRLTDLKQLARMPNDGEKVMLASSFDRVSTYDASAGQYVMWDANHDGDGVVRREGDEAVLMDVQGPGCIWRMWSARPDPNNHVKIFLDGASTPAIDLPFLSYFDGKTAPFDRPNLVYSPSEAAHGFDNYTPIPFRKSCKIVGDPGWGAYYQFTYSRFAPDTVVPTFQMQLSPDDSAALDEANKTLGQCGKYPGGEVAGAETVNVPLTVKAGQAATVVDLHGAGALTELRVKINLPTDPEAQRLLLRQLTISIAWDGALTPAVWSPLGDFFGYVGGADAFQSLPVGLQADGTFYSYWYMPYGKEARIQVGNDGTLDVPLTWQVVHAPLSVPAAQLLRFHAKWHRDAFLSTAPGRAIDWTLLTTRGSGRYVGTHLHVWNPRGGWWGEGDDKFFVDGERFPSNFGTGSEDYFGYAWSSAGHFSRPFHNQILNEDNAGHADDNRWHIPDALPFSKSLEADIEKYFGNDRGTLYAAEAYWYLDPSGIDPYPAVSLADRAGYWIRPDTHHEPSAIEGESLRPIGTPPPSLHAEEMWKFGMRWSGDRQLTWNAQAPGEQLRLALPVTPPGHYRLIANITKGPAYGKFQIAFNGVNLGPPRDYFSPIMTTTQPVDLGMVTFADPHAELSVTAAPKNPASSAMTFGLDYLKLVPLP